MLLDMAVKEREAGLICGEVDNRAPIVGDHHCVIVVIKTPKDCFVKAMYDS